MPVQEAHDMAWLLRARIVHGMYGSLEAAGLRVFAAGVAFVHALGCVRGTRHA